jgi:hypothetical protein
VTKGAKALFKRMSDAYIASAKKNQAILHVDNGRVKSAAIESI